MNKNVVGTTIAGAVLTGVVSVITTKVLGTDILQELSAISLSLTVGIVLAVGITVIVGVLFIITINSSRPHDLQGRFYTPPKRIKSDEYLSDLRSEVAKRRALYEELAAYHYSPPPEGIDVDTFSRVKNTVLNRLETAKRELADAEATLIVREAEIKTHKADWIGIGHDGSVTFWQNKSKEETSTHAKSN